MPAALLWARGALQSPSLAWGRLLGVVLRWPVLYGLKGPCTELAPEPPHTRLSLSRLPPRGKFSQIDINSLDTCLPLVPGEVGSAGGLWPEDVPTEARCTGAQAPRSVDSTVALAAPLAVAGHWETGSRFVWEAS